MDISALFSLFILLTIIELGRFVDFSFGNSQTKPKKMEWKYFLLIIAIYLDVISGQGEYSFIDFLLLLKKKKIYKTIICGINISLAVFRLKIKPLQFAKIKTCGFGFYILTQKWNQTNGFKIFFGFLDLVKLLILYYIYEYMYTIFFFLNLTYILLI